jgi:3-oxoacyl-[acyl-carrier protein] reductase
MELGISEKVAVVTGASKGIGAATVMGLAAEGANVACCARGRDALEQLQKDAAGLPGSVHTWQCDLTVAEELDHFFDEVGSSLGQVDILVNNLGASPSRNFLYMSADDWQTGLTTNLLVALRCTQLVLPGMRKKKWGRVIMVSSGAAKYPSAPLIDYAAAKAALLAATKSLARKYGSDQILVNAVLPGLIRTDMWERTAQEIAESAGTSVEGVFDERGARVPLSRFGTAQEVADVIVYLASNRAGYVNGALVDVDGGLGDGI